MFSSPDFLAIQKRIAESNLNAAGNQNLYPIQEQATLKEIWEYVPCTCDKGCTCRRWGCAGHWRLKDNLEFDDILPAFLRMFVNKPNHIDLINLVSKPASSSDPVSDRAKGALLVLRFMRSNWANLYSRARQHNKTLLCDDWYNSYWQQQWEFPWQEGTIYRAKQYCILLPDIAVPYDTKSRLKLQQAVTAGGTYFHLLQEIRRQLIAILQANRQNIPSFRKLDTPQNQIPFDSRLITLPQAKVNYGFDYSPKERPLSRVIDKYFYQPGDIVSYQTSNRRELYITEAVSSSVPILPKIPKLVEHEAPRRLKQPNPTEVKVKKIIADRFAASGNPARIPKIKAGFFTASIIDEGIHVDNLGGQPFLPWEVFSEAVELMVKNNGFALKGDAMNCKLGDANLSLNSVEGHIARVVYGKRVGSSVFRRITPIACVLIWAGLCRNETGILILIKHIYTGIEEGRE